MPLLIVVLFVFLAVAVGVGIAVATSGSVSPNPRWLAPFALLIGFAFLRADRPAGFSTINASFTDQAAVALLAGSMFAMTWNGVRIAGVFAISDLLLMGATVCAIPSLIRTREHRRMLPPAWVLIPAGIFVVTGLVSLLFLGDVPGSLIGLLRLVIAMTLVPFAFGVIGGQLKAVVLLVDLWILSALVNSFVAISDYILGTTIGLGITHVESLGRSTGLTTHSNHLAYVVVLTLPLAIGRLSTARTKPMQLFFAAACGALLMAVMASGSRGGLVGVALAIGVTPLLMPRELRKRAMTMIGLVIVVAVLIGSFSFRDQALVGFERLTGGSSSTQSAVSESDQIRAGVRKEAIANFTRNPITGSGLAHSRDAHNIYLQLLASTGVVGTLAFISYLFGYFLLSRKTVKQRGRSIEIRTIAATAGVSAITWGILGLVENQIADRYLFVPCGFVVACAWYSVSGRSDGSAPVDAANFRPSLSR